MSLVGPRQFIGPYSTTVAARETASWRVNSRDPGYVERLAKARERRKEEMAERLDGPIVSGTAFEHGHVGGGRGWFIGHFIDAMRELRRRNDIEVKWGVHTSGDHRSDPGTSNIATTLTLLVSGTFSDEFPGRDKNTMVLARAADYVLYGPGVSHTWEVLEDAVVITVRWPSVPEIRVSGP